MELRSPRLLLRDFREEDVARVAAYQRRYDGPAPADDEVRALVDRFRAWAAEVPRRSYQLAITLDSVVIGTCGVRRDQDDVAEFGCELDPDFWGHGYAYEASAALLAFARDELRIDRVIARTQPDNRAAIRLAEQLGFRMRESGLLVLEASLS